MILTRESLKQHVRVAKSGCWIWQRARMGEGYGVLRLRGAWRYAHRVAYELFHGRIPRGRLVCHRCATPSCVRPDHLYAGDHSSNMLDFVRGRRTVRQVRAA